MREEFDPLIKFCCTRPDSYRDVPATETKSIGLPATVWGTKALPQKYLSFLYIQ